MSHDNPCCFFKLITTLTAGPLLNPLRPQPCFLLHDKRRISSASLWEYLAFAVIQKTEWAALCHISVDVLQMPCDYHPNGSTPSNSHLHPNYSLSIVTLISMARSDQQSTRKSRSPFEVLRFIAWLLLLIVSISTPAVKSLFFFSLTSNKPGFILIHGTNYSTTGVVRFGAYGYCVPFVSDGYVVRLRVCFRTLKQLKLGRPLLIARTGCSAIHLMLRSKSRCEFSHESFLY